MINTINSIATNETLQESTIKLNPGTYKLTQSTFINTVANNNKNIIIELNNQTLSANMPNTMIRFNNKCNLTFNNGIINHSYVNQGNNITMNNITIYNIQLLPGTNLTLNNTNIKGNQFSIGQQSTVNIENQTTYGLMLSNTGTLNTKNVTLKSVIINMGKIVINENVEFDSSLSIRGNGKIIIDNYNTIFPYLEQFNDETILELQEYSKPINNNGNLTIENSTLVNTINNNANSIFILKNSSTNNNITNKGTLILDNTYVDSTIENTGVLVITDNSIIGENFYLSGAGEIIINDTKNSFIFKYIQ